MTLDKERPIYAKGPTSDHRDRFTDDPALLDAKRAMVDLMEAVILKDGQSVLRLADRLRDEARRTGAGTIVIQCHDIDRAVHESRWIDAFNACRILYRSLEISHVILPL
ncbi:MAG: hypothetical protein ACXWNK_06480 [Vulcanimicrobiaceae bacterium]